MLPVNAGWYFVIGWIVSANFLWQQCRGHAAWSRGARSSHSQYPVQENTKFFRARNPTTTKSINSPDRSLKRDYESLLVDNGWTKQQLTALSVMFEIIYLDQSNIRTIHPARPAPSKATAGNASHYQQLCPHNITLHFTAFGREINAILKLNKYLHAPNLSVKTISKSAADITAIKGRDECYYQGRDTSPFGTYSVGKSGHLRAFIQVQGKSIVILPLAASVQTTSSQKDWRNDPLDFRIPHLVYIPKNYTGNTEGNTCGATSSAKNWRKHLRPGHSSSAEQLRKSRSPRDIRFQTKWIELALLFDSSMMNLIKVSHQDAVEVALSLTNLIDQVYRPLKTRVILTYLELWSGNNQMHITRESSSTLLNLMSYSTENLYSVAFDSLQLLASSTKGFSAGELGIASTNSVCTLKSVGVVNIVNFHLNVLSTAVELSHMIAHNLGVHHDSSKDKDCACPNIQGCIMQPTLLSEESGYRPIFSSCSQDDYYDALHTGQAVCLISSPFQENSLSTTCGNGITDHNEDCDCGGFIGCLGKTPCCDPITCLFKDGAECAEGSCCTTECKFKKEGNICRNAKHDCDVPEYCNGTSGACPNDGFKKTGHYCETGKSYCFNRTCISHDDQCQEIWGPKSQMAPVECHKRFNSEGMFNGHCGIDEHGDLKACAEQDLLCGTVQCEGGEASPLLPSAHQFSAATTVITSSGKQLECKTRSTDLATPDVIARMLAKDGTKCGVNKVCLDGKCRDISPFIQLGNCPSNNVALICSGHGLCSDLNNCSCDPTFVGADCSRRVSRLANENLTKETEDQINWKRSLMSDHTKNGTTTSEIIDNFMMLIIMASLIGLFLLLFLFALLCYKRTSTEAEPFTDYYASSERSGLSSDISPISLKPTSSFIAGENCNHMDQHDFTPTTITCATPIFERSPVHGCQHSLSRNSLLHSPRPPFKRSLRRDVASSPFVKRKLSSRQFLLAQASPCKHQNGKSLDDQNSGDSWTPAAYPGTSPAKEKYIDLTYTPPYRAALPSPVGTPRFQGRIRIKNFNQLLQELDDFSGTPTPSVVTVPVTTMTCVATPETPGQRPLPKTCDAESQVNMDTDYTPFRSGEDDERAQHELPPAMDELNLPRMMNHNHATNGSKVGFSEAALGSGKDSSDAEILWMPLRSPGRLGGPSPTPSSQRRRQIFNHASRNGRRHGSAFVNGSPTHGTCTDSDSDEELEDSQRDGRTAVPLKSSLSKNFGSYAINRVSQ